MKLSWGLLMVGFLGCWTGAGGQQETTPVPWSTFTVFPGQPPQQPPPGVAGGPVGQPSGAQVVPSIGSQVSVNQQGSVQLPGQPIVPPPLPVGPTGVQQPTPPPDPFGGIGTVPPNGQGQLAPTPPFIPVTPPPLPSGLLPTAITTISTTTESSWGRFAFANTSTTSHRNGTRWTQHPRNWTRTTSPRPHSNATNLVGNTTRNGNATRPSNNGTRITNTTASPNSTWGSVWDRRNQAVNRSRQNQTTHQANHTASWMNRTSSTTPTRSTTTAITTTTMPPTTTLPPGPVVSGVRFSDFDEHCPDNLPVRAFSYKTLIDDTGGGQKDYQIKALCYPKVSFDNGSALNLSDADCSYRQAFSIDDDDVHENDTAYMCSPGEYINGAQSEYWEGQRLIRIRCCKSPLLHYSLDHGCHNWHVEQTNEILQTRQSSKCPIEVLTAVRLVSPNKDRPIVRYCGLAAKDSKYSAVCQFQRKLELDRLQNWSISSTPIPFEVFLNSNRRSGVAPRSQVSSGNFTEPGLGFVMICDEYQAVRDFRIEQVGDDYKFNFECSRVAPNLDGMPPTRRSTDFETMAGWIADNRTCDQFGSDFVICGVDSYRTGAEVDGTSERMYAFLCCQYANADVVEKKQIVGETIRNHVSRPDDEFMGEFLTSIQLTPGKSKISQPMVSTQWARVRVTNSRKPKSIDPSMGALAPKSSSSSKYAMKILIGLALSVLGYAFHQF